MIGNTNTTWGWPAKVLHWLAAILILFLLGHGWWMTHMAPRPDRLAHYAWHSALGYDLLALITLRLLWRWTHTVPALPDGLATWERWSARAGHFGLYLLMFASTLTGWVLAGTFRVPMNQDMFGVTVPQLIAIQDRSVRRTIEESHMILSYALGVLVAVHVIGALRHHLVKHNDVLRRMWFGSRSV
ncbi:MAG TPA: cytochrome b/b6 domain-containing protein [Xanthobacteraceae bacterium]|nr:cytochrome b/b6 domain-containing protein [Xanthobacteraceae bacterium]